MKRLLLLACAVTTLLLAGCTGVPSSSAPQTIERVHIAPAEPGPAISPTPGEQPFALVQDFLQAAAEDPPGSSSARAFLTPAAASQWSDSTVTVVQQILPGEVTNGSVTVYGKVVGHVDAHGVYAPTLEGQGLGGPKQPFTFTIGEVKGQYRISGLPAGLGLLLTDRQFHSAFRQYPLYYYDSADKYLVPDYRWVPVADPTEMARWLLDELIAGPRSQLQNGVTNDTLPAQLDPARTVVTAVDAGTEFDIEIPGAAQLAGHVKYRLAAQLAQMFGDLFTGRPIRITDDKRPITIPTVQSTTFTSGDFESVTGPPPPTAEVYYVNDGSVYSQSLQPLAGPLGGHVYSLQSIAASRPNPSGPLLVAGVARHGRDQQLFVGTQYDGLKASTVVGQLSRPAFAPGRPEVWVGSGPRIYRVVAGATPGRPVEVPIPSVAGGGPVQALRLSPDGSRIAMVVGGSAGSAGLYLGTVVRSANQVRVDDLQLISPQAAVVQDATWLDSSQLFAIGYLSTPKAPRTFRVYVDGSDWRASPTNLADPPDAVTGASSHEVWVSAGGHIWVQTQSGWSSPGPKDQTPGTNPVYLE